MSRVFFLKSKSFGVKARNYPKRIIDRYELFLENESVKSMIIEYVVSDFYIFLILFISHEFYLPELLERNIDDMKAFWYVSDGNEKTTKKIFSNVSIHSPSIKEANVEYDKETGKSNYSIMSGLPINFEEDELREFLYNHRKVINVTEKLSIQVNEKLVGTIFTGRKRI